MIYCVYITTYHGNLMPSYYIGSSKVCKVESGYRGSVRSKKWRHIWESELTNNPSLFETKILSYHETRQDALSEELRIQLLNEVVKSHEWINESYARLNGYFGRDVSGSANPMYGKGNNVIKWCSDNREKVSKRNRKAAKTQWADKKSRENKIAGMMGKSKTLKTLSKEEFSELQSKKALQWKEKHAIRLEYKGIVYLGWNELLEKTGVSKHLYKKYYLNGIDPEPRIGKDGPQPSTL